VHGDLWGGNASVLADGRGALIDPACWWADREVDLAMTRLFGGFSACFYQSYQEEWPLDANYQDRIDVYNLYHLLNHANLFGGSYKQQCLTAITAMRSMLL
jgi:fructosamine-3-kinase